jgi:hypothetical protein
MGRRVLDVVVTVLAVAAGVVSSFYVFGADGYFRRSTRNCTRRCCPRSRPPAGTACCGQAAHSCTWRPHSRYLSEATVKTHITRTFAKLDVSSRVQLTIFAYEAGVVTP